MAITIRQATAADVDTVCEFNRLLALESENKSLDFGILKPGVTAVLTDAAKGLYFLATEEDNILGQMGVTYEWSDWRNGWFWWIQSVYVRLDARRRGVCRRLLEAIRQLAQSEYQAIGLRLYVERENIRAQESYRKMGFEWTTYQVMEQYPLR
jgi:ribosomal protein S18 acetylase RimI-like enzyme